MERRSLVSLDDFENRKKLFLGVDSRMKFCLLCLTAPGSGPEAAEFSFFNTNISHLSDLTRKFFLTPEDFRRINPNTLTCPTFRTGRDAEITLKMYKHAGVFIDENDPENGNPWGTSFMRMFDMSNDSSLFHTAEELEAQGLELQGNRYVGNGELYLPLYEGKMLHQYNHRFSHVGTDGNARELNSEELTSSLTMSLPRYWVQESRVRERVGSTRWFIGFRDVTNATNERSAIFSVVPRSAVNHKAPLLFCTNIPELLLANFCSLPLDYVTRQKIGGTSLGYFIVKQLPLLGQLEYRAKAHVEISKRVLELTYTAWDIKAFADDLWREADEDLRGRFRAQWQANAEASGGGHPFDPPEWADIDPDGCPLAPFTWNEERRAELRAELDALYAHLYGLTRDELLWILDPRDVDPTTPSVTFPGLRRNEEKKYGEYRTKRLVLKHYDALAEKLGEPVKEMA